MFSFIVRAVFAIASLVGFGLLAGSGTDTNKSAGPSGLNELSMEVTALQALYQFDFTPVQFDLLRKIAAQTGQGTGARMAAKSSAKFRQAMLDLHAGLAKGSNADHINDLQERLEDLRDAENPELDDGWEVTEEARSKAPELFRLLSSRQIVAFLSAYGSEFADPFELVSDALDKVRGLDDQQWKDVRETVAETAGRQAAGLDAEKAEEIGDKIIQLLIQARGMKEAEFKSERKALLKSAREILGTPSSLDVIRHFVEYSLAELLSNPRLPSAIALVSKK
jgi:hypothetical protein